MDIFKEEWSRAADVLGLDFAATRSGKIHKDFNGVMSGTIDGFPVKVRTRTERGGETGTTRTTMFTVGLTGFDGRSTLLMRPAKRRFRGWRLFRSRWVTFDDPEFDNQFAVRCEDPDVLWLHFDASRRRRIQECTKEHPDWRIVEGQVVSQHSDIVTRAGILVEPVQSQVAVAHAVSDL